MPLFPPRPFTTDDGSTVLVYREADARDLLGYSRPAFRRLGLPHHDALSGRHRKEDWLYDIEVLRAFRTEHGTRTDQRAARARASFTKHRRWTDSEGVSRPTSEHPHYGAWKHMVSRCHDERDKDYDDYGGRGITVYEPWRTDPLAYCEHLAALGPRRPGDTADRIDNDGSYVPGNLRWADRETQNRNRRSCIADDRDAAACVCLHDCGSSPDSCPVEAFDWDAAASAFLEFYAEPFTSPLSDEVWEDSVLLSV